MEQASELAGLVFEPASRPTDLCDSPPTRRQTSRWQQLKAGWTDGSSTGGVRVDQSNDCTSPASKLQLLGSLTGDLTWNLTSEHQEGADLIAAADTDVAAILQRCADIQHAAQQEHSTADVDNSLQEQPASVPHGYSSSALLSLLSHPPCMSDTLSADPAESTYQLQQTLDQTDEGYQQQGQHVDLSGAFDHLLSRQQQQYPKGHVHSRRASATRGTGQPLARSSTSTGVGTTPNRQSTSTARAQQHGMMPASAPAGVWAAPAQQPQRPQLTSTIRHSRATVSSPQAADTAAVAAARTPGTARRATGARASSVQQTQPAASGQVLAPVSSTQPADLSRAKGMPAVVSSAPMQPAAQPTTVTGRPAEATVAINTGSRSSLAASTGQQLAGSAAGQAAGPGNLQVELSASSRMSTSSSSSMRACQADLQLELAAVSLFRLLRRWRLAAVEVAVDKARARPMYNLLSKRKVMRAWRMSHTIHSSSSSDCSPQQQHTQPHQQQSLPQPQPAPKQQQQQHQQQRLQHHRQPPQQQQQQSSQATQEALKRLQVACQFHRLYRQHSCLLHWQAWAAAAAQARRQLQQQEQLQQRQRALAQQQEELLAEFQWRQQQELLQQQEQARLHVAQRFHTLYMLHSSLRTWHKHASISAALRKLHPTLPIVQAAIAGASTVTGCDGTDRRSSNDPGLSQQAASRVHMLQLTGGDVGAVQCTSRESSSSLAVGLLDPAVVQQKAQLLLQHLASKAAGGAEQQQQQASESTQQQAPEHTKQAKQQKQKPQQQRGLAAKATRSKPLKAGVVSSTTAPLQHHSTPISDPDHVNAANQQVQQQAQLPLSQQQQQQQQLEVAASRSTDGPLQKAADCAAQQEPATEQGGDSGAASSMSAAAPASVEPTTAACSPEHQQDADTAAALAQVSADCANSSGDDVRQQQQMPQALAADSELQGQDQPEQQTDPQQQQQSVGVANVQLGLGVIGSTAYSSPVHCAGEPSPSEVHELLQQVALDGALQQQDQQQGQSPEHHQEQQQVQQPRQQQDLQQQQKQRAERAQQQQQQQLEWPQERQRLQQQIRQLQAEEQRRHRQYQQVEQQLQAVLTQQLAELAAVHATRLLVRRAGLGPWLGLMKLRAHQWLLAGRLYQWHLLNIAMMGLRHAVLCRHKRHTCAHIQAWGKLRAVHQQQQQSGALSALWIWSLTGRHYRRQLVLRCMQAWRAAAAEGAAVVVGVTGALRALWMHQVLAAWWGYVQEQAHQHLLVDLELTAVADNWRSARLQRCALLTWREHAAAAARQRVQEAAHQQTWSRVRGWLTELDGGDQGAAGRGGLIGVGEGSGSSRGEGCALAAALAPLVGPGAQSSNDLHSGVWAVGPDAGAAGAGPTEVPDWDDWSEDVDGDGGPYGDVQGGAGAGGSVDEAHGHAAVEDLAALTEWFEAVGRDLDAAS